MFLIKDLEIDTTKIKRASNEYDIEHRFDSWFDRIGLVYQAQNRILRGKPDCLIGDIIIDFKFKIKKKTLNLWVESKGRQYIEEYYKTRGRNPSLLVVISESFIWYYDTNLILKNKCDVNEKTIKSLLECLLEPKKIDSEQFATLFGVNSPLYILAYSRLENRFDDHNGEKTVCFQQWKKHFSLAYHDQEVGKELFLRHSYLSMLIKLILYKEFLDPEQYSRDYFKDLKNYFELLGISLFHHDFFLWVINVPNLCDDYFEKIKLLSLKATDIFRTIYQEMIIAGVRHKLGEYYTPELLCKKMVDKFYKIGDRVLDSSCGSGTFIIEIYKNIDQYYNILKNSNLPEQWFNAINNIFGFDINPIAVLTTKANCILYFKDKKDFIEKIDINIYLCNSIDPLEFSESSDLELGKYYSFCVDLISDELQLKIPSDFLEPSKIESFQLLIKAIYNVWEDFNKFKDTWDAAISSNEILKEIYSEQDSENNKSIHQFFKILFDLKIKDKDHIWLYILNNLVGIRILLLRKKMDLIITNPPWLTYKDADPKLKKTMKKISDQFDIKPAAQNITNIEEAVVFLYKIPDLYLKKDGKGKIAFVMPKSLIMSSQNEKARRFEPFENIELFEFDDMVFNIDCCCIFALYNRQESPINKVFDKYPIISHFINHNDMQDIEMYHREPYIYFQEKSGQKYTIKKLIKSEKKNDLLPCHLSDYYRRFLQGADLIPKSLLYCEVSNIVQNGNIAVINPWISPQAKAPWNKSHYKNQRIETDCLFQATLSREMYPFYIEPRYIFLPLNKNYAYSISSLGPFSRKHWELIKDIYFKVLNKDLFDIGINYRNKLCTNSIVKKKQRMPYKIIFPNAKSLCSAVIEDPNGRIFIDSTLYYYGTTNKIEAHYLCGMLNIPELSKSVKIISDTRHHHKRPLYFNIPKFNNTKEQLLIASLSESCHKKVRNYIEKGDKIKESELNSLIQVDLKEIIVHGLNILKSVESSKVIREYLFI
ncbi:MAG: N-6 DNA methylase [Candidatus Lokiarchaeota archaeon]|nr:N-6 DNA methylase [Candidatus Lokiarchaeota archaeon]